MAAWLAILALYLAVRLPLLDVPLERDEGAFALVGRAILAGAVPYRDVFDHKPPGVYYLYAAALPFIPASARGVHGFLLLWNLATLACVASLARALAGAAAGRWAALVFVVVSSGLSVQGFSTTTEMLLLLPLTASLRLTIAGLAPAPRWILLAVAGALGAAACWIKQPAAAPLLAAPLWVAVAERRHPRRAASALAAWLGGGVGLSAGIVALFGGAGAWTELWYWVVTYNRLYTASGTVDWLGRLGLRLPDVGWELGAPLALALLGATVGLVQRRASVWFAVTLLLLSLAAVAHSPFFYAHYFALAAPGLAVAAGMGAHWLCAAARRGGGAMAAAAVGVAALAALLIPPAIGRPWYWLRPDPLDVARRKWGGQGFEHAPLLADYLRQRTAPEESVFIYGSEPQVAFLAGRREASGFATVYPLTASGPRQRQHQERAWSAIAAARPRYVLVSRNPASLMRATDMDPFLEQQLRDLLLRQYRREAYLVADAEQAQISAEPVAGAAILLEIWRRVDS